MLNGPSNRGKTTTIRIVHNLVISHGGVSLTAVSTNGDFTDEVNFALQINCSRRLYFNSAGDTVKCICAGIHYALNNGFDKIICACNDSFYNGNGVQSVRLANYLNSIANSITLIRVPKRIQIPWNRNPLNPGMSQIVANLLDSNDIFALI